MDTSRSRSVQLNGRRLISVVLFLAVFFLPLHFHFNSSAKVAQECTCVQGTRMQLAPISSIATHAPIVTVGSVVIVLNVPPLVEHIGLQSVRAPPDSLSI